MSERDFERLGGTVLHEGSFISLHRDRFRYPDGTRSSARSSAIPARWGWSATTAATSCSCDSRARPWATRTRSSCPRASSSRARSVLDTARRELAEEVGLAAERWEALTSYYSSLGVMDEEVHVYLATGLREASADSGEDERIEVVRWPLADLDGALAATKDAKTVIGLLLLRERLA